MEQRELGDEVMTPDQEQALTEKLTSIGYPDFEIMPGEDSILMLHIDGRLVCGTLYALAMPDDQLKALVDETVAGGTVS